MKLTPETVLTSLANPGMEGGKTARPRSGAQSSSALDFFSQLQDRSDRNLRHGLAGVSSAAVAVSGTSTDVARSEIDARSAHRSKASDAVRKSSAPSDARAPAEPMPVAGVDWPWLAIATGGLSYRPTSSASASSAGSPFGTSAAPRAASTQAEATHASSTLGRAAGVANQPASPASLYILSAMTFGPPASAASEVRELNTAAWPLPAELREMLERRRLRVVEDGEGGLHLFARDFAMDDAQTAQWAASLKNAFQAMNQTLHALWINGRPYDIKTGELHDR